jgi:hypothetical protein
MRRLAWLILAVAAIYAAAAGYRIQNRMYYIWLPDYLRQSMRARETPQGPVHIFFYFTDHFEPASHHYRTHRWEQEYPKLADRHRDSAGRPVQHTWFYPGEQPDEENMAALKNLVAGGYGEVELHYHHFNDTDDSARAKFARAIADFQRYGFLKTVQGDTRFAFIHGNWALDNSVPGMCGANHELKILRELGCFADFTFPALWQAAQPSLANAIFEATDDDGPKSYDKGTRVRVGQEPVGDLMLFEGPLQIVPSRNAKHLFWDVEDGDVHHAVPLSEKRVDAWIDANVHVEGRPEWVFVKVHGHEASTDIDVDDVLGAPFDRVLTYMESRYNDGQRYVLHYITAREAYNLVRAAVAGQQGDPSKFLDWVIPRYVAGGRPPAAVSKVTADSPGGH